MKRQSLLGLALLLLGLLWWQQRESPQAATAVTIAADSAFQVDVLVRDLGVPWGQAWLNPKELLVTDRQGRLWRVRWQEAEKQQVQGLPAISAGGQGGLLDVAVSPNYATDGWLYFSYVKAVDERRETTLARARLKADRLIDWQDLLVTRSGQSGGHHFGSRITFMDGHVLFGVGDRGERDLAQDLSNHAGSILRLSLDGAIPADNPFVSRPDARPEIWSYGHRNPQGLVYDPQRDTLWSMEHGPRGGDELNRIQRGANYGWPVISYGKEYALPVAVGEGTHKEGMEQPVKIYVPSIAPGSLLLYQGQAFADWQGDLLAGALKLQHLNRIRLSPQGEVLGEERLLAEWEQRLRSLSVGPQGCLFVGCDDGSLRRVCPAGFRGDE